MSSIIPHVVCSICEQSRPIESFYIRENGRRRAECKACFLERRKVKRNADLASAQARQRARHQARKDDPAYIQQRRGHRAKHRDETLVKKAEYRAARRDDLSAKQRERYRKNPDRTKQYCRQWRAANRERKNASERARRLKNWERTSQLTRITKAKRRDRIAGARYQLRDWQAMCDWFGDACLCCHSSAPITVDHVIPLARGGTNTIENLQPLCDKCNKSKGARRATDYRNPVQLAQFLASIGH